MIKLLGGRNRENKYTIDEQIEHMKCKGILFNLISEDDAKNI